MADQPTRGTPVAQDDVLGEAARATGPVEGLDVRPDSDPMARDRADATRDGAAPPGRDENQAGFVKDADKRFSP